MFVVSFAMADMCVGFIMPFNAYREHTGTFIKDMVNRKIFCEVITSLEVVLICASIYNLLALSLDRLYLIKYPLKFQMIKSSKKDARWIIIFCWLFAMVPAAPLWSGSDTRTAANTNCWNICSFPYDSVSILPFHKKIFNSWFQFSESLGKLNFDILRSSGFGLLL